MLGESRLLNRLWQSLKGRLPLPWLVEAGLFAAVGIIICASIALTSLPAFGSLQWAIHAPPALQKLLLSISFSVAVLSVYMLNNSHRTALPDVDDGASPLERNILAHLPQPCEAIYQPTSLM